VKALTRKLLRDLVHMGGAVITIALVVGAGIAAYVTLRGTYLSIVQCRDKYYSAERFGDAFSALERAPLALAKQLENLPGVTRVYPRVVGSARIPMPKLTEPAQADVVSIPETGPAPLNGVLLVGGRLPRASRDDEALLLEAFAERHGIRPGAVLNVVMEGHERPIHVVGIAMSPEYVLAMPNGAAAPAPDRFAVLWMHRPAVEAAFDMRGAFNSVVLRLSPSAEPAAVTRLLDRELDAYGGLGALARARQLSNYYLDQDLVQLRTLATIAPAIFLGVAAFLLNVVLSRLIELDRPQIATLKAVGYTNLEVGLHYLELAMLVAVVGAVLGIALGTQLGAGMTAMYVRFYRMPGLAFHMDAAIALGAVVVSLSAALVGALLSVRSVVLLPPAEAMRPAAPPSYKHGRLSAALARWLGASARMVLRELFRRPLRTLLSAVGIAAATGILVLGQYFSDAVGFLVDFYIQKQQRETLAVTFVAPVPEASVHALRALPGVVDVQWQALLQVRVRAAHRERVVLLAGHAARGSMRPLLDERGGESGLDPGEVVFTEMLAKVLQVRVGDEVQIEPMQGDRTLRRLRVTRTLPELMGLCIHMPFDDLHRWLAQDPYVSTAMLVVNEADLPATQRALRAMPSVASAMQKRTILTELRSQMGDTMGTFSFVLTAFAVTIAVSVVYNNARVSVSLRGRELASLRVLGFTRGEISSILIAELFAQVLLGIPLGLYFGKELVRLMLSMADPESFRFPSIISTHTYAFAALVTFGAAMVSALLVRRKLDQLNLIEVLKTRE
jgi:putative ABC transport system permease protein